MKHGAYFSSLAALVLSLLALPVEAALVTAPTGTARTTSSPVQMPTTTVVTSTPTPRSASSSVPLSTDFIVTVEDIVRGGYIAPVRITSTPRQYLEPVRYFRVKDAMATSTPGCGSCSIVAVYVTRHLITSTPEWAATMNPRVTVFDDDRRSVAWFAGNRIIYVIGPGAEKPRRLAEWLRQRVILNKTF